MEQETQRRTPVIEVALPPKETSQYSHQKRIATKCGHQLHTSASPHTPYCPSCLLARAREKLELAQDHLVQNGGLQCPWNLRDQNWKNAYLSYCFATRHLERVRKKDQLRWEREQAWDEAHLQADLTRIDEGGSSSPDSPCPICMTVVAPPKSAREVACKDIAWWERPGALAPENKQHAPPRPRNLRRCKSSNQPKSSPAIRQTIREHRAALVSIEAEQKQLERRYKTEVAVRRKHQLGDETQFDGDFWDSPISAVITRQNHQQIKDYKRSQERRARGNTPRPRPPRSSLSHCESVGEFEVDESLKHVWSLMEEVEQQQRIERKARKVGAEVGYLYFVGDNDGLEEWKEDYLRSNHNLVWRERYQRGGSIEAMCLAPSPPNTPQVECVVEEDRMDIDEEL